MLDLGFVQVAPARLATASDHYFARITAFSHVNAMQAMSLLMTSVPADYLNGTESSWFSTLC